jgi:flagellar protein FliS
MSYGIGAYKNTSVKTASKEQILLMLYQAAIKNCKKAIEAIESNDIQKKGEFIGRMQDIIIELTNSLDHNVGGDISKELNSLYDFILHETTQANIHLDAKRLEGCLGILTTLYDGWTKAVKQLKENPHCEE